MKARFLLPSRHELILAYKSHAAVRIPYINRQFIRQNCTNLQSPPLLDSMPAEPSNSQPPRKVEGMSLLQRCLGLASQDTENSKVKADGTKTTLSDVVFISIDLEAYEFAQQKITEIGVAILDTRKVIGTDPGPNADLWLAQIQARHIRIKEYQRLVNKKFIPGCPDKFNFGTSEFVRLNDIRNVLFDIFNNPLGVQAPTFERRNIVLVGHGLKNDTDYLKSLHFSPNVNGQIVHHMDTINFSGSTKTKTIGLERLLRGLGRSPENLHNAGNDAVYTLQALIMMAVQHTAEPGVYLQAIQDVVMPESFKQKFRREAKARRAAKMAVRDADADKSGNGSGSASVGATTVTSKRPEGS